MAIVVCGLPCSLWHNTPLGCCVPNDHLKVLKMKLVVSHRNWRPGLVAMVDIEELDGRT